MVKTFLDKTTNKNFERIRGNKFLLLTNFFFRIVKNNPGWFMFSSLLAFSSALVNYNASLMVKENFLTGKGDPDFSEELITSFRDEKETISKEYAFGKIDTLAENKNANAKIDEIKREIAAAGVTEDRKEISRMEITSIIKEIYGLDKSIESKNLSFFFNFGFYRFRKSLSWRQFIIVFISFLIFVKSLISVGHWYANSFIGDKLEKDLKLELFSVLMRSSYEKSSSVADRMITQFSSDLDGISKNIWNIPNRLVYVLTSIALSFLFDFRSKEGEKTHVAFIVVICALFAVLSGVVALLLKKSIVLGIEAKRRYEGDNRAIFERMRKLKYIKINSSEQVEQEKITGLLDNTFRSNKQSLLWTALFKALPNYLITPTIPWMFMAIVTFAGIGGRGPLTLATVGSLYFVISKLNSEIGKVLDSILALEELSSDLSIVTDSVVALSASQEEAEANSTNDVENGEIVFKDVSFFYPSRPDNIILKNLSFTFENGKKYGIAGKNGIGKSTITSILLKLRKISSGQILIGGSDINDITNEALHRNTCHLTNHPTFFRTSIAENVLYPFLYNRAEDLPRLVEAAKKTKIMSFINSLPAGFDTVLSEDGSDLSEGQKQQLEAMKVFLRDYKLYIFDEILSNVHPLTRKEILANIFLEVQNRTVITIDHQYDIFEHMDQIYSFLSDRFVEKERDQELS